MKTICLDAHSTSDLQWDLSISSEVVWQLDFGWKALDLFDTAQFNAALFAVEEFAKKVSKPCKVILAKSDGFFSKFLLASERLETLYREFPIQNYELFCATVFSEYLHRLASVLSEEIQPCIFLDISPRQSLAQIALLLCKRRFEHFELFFSQESFCLFNETSIGVSLPQDQFYKEEDIEKIFQKLIQKKLPFKCIPEELLNEHWDGLNYLIVDTKALSTAGKRMLFGFEAAGGQIIATEELPEFPDALNLEGFLQENGL